MSGAVWLGGWTGISYSLFQNRFVKDNYGNEVSYKSEFIPSGVDYGTIEIKGDLKQCALMILKEATNKPVMGFSLTTMHYQPPNNTWGPFEFQDSEVKLHPRVYDANENTQKLLQEFKTLYKMKAFW